MSLKPDLVGTEFAPVPFEYDARDVMLYALSVGCTPDELDFLYEGRGPKVLPTFAVVPPFEFLFAALREVGMPLERVVHGEQAIELFGPIPPAAEVVTTARLEALWDKGKHAVAVLAAETALAGATAPLFRTTWSILGRGCGGFGGVNGKGAAFAEPPADRGADFSSQQATAPTQALLYRLNGDRNPLHADPAFAQRAGFDAPILHGLCTFGFAGRALLGAVGGDVDRIASLRVRFTAPVTPGATLVTRGWLPSSANDRLAVIRTSDGADDVVLAGEARLR